MNGPRSFLHSAKVLRILGNCSFHLELPSIGWQLFILDSSQSDPIALPAFLDTYATRLLTEPLSPRVFRKEGAVPPSRHRDRPLPAARCARRPERWPRHRARRSYGRCRSRAPAPVPKAWVARPPQTRQTRTTSLPDADRDRQRSPPPNDVRGTVSPSVRGLSSRRGSVER